MLKKVFQLLVSAVWRSAHLLLEPQFVFSLMNKLHFLQMNLQYLPLGFGGSV